MPDLRLEERLWRQGRRHIAGVDEAGRGSLFGPVVAAAVILPLGLYTFHRSAWPDWLLEVDDSKLLAPAKRERLARHILAEAEAVGIGQCSNIEIDDLNIHRASLRAMGRAVAGLPCDPDVLLVDGFALKEVHYPQVPVKRGDRLSLSIAAASIVAKVLRDAMMMRLDSVFEGFGLAQHKGYATRVHYSALARFGPTAGHRRSFRLRTADKGR